MRFIGLRAVFAAALMFSVLAPAAMPSTVAASGRTCQTAYYYFPYAVSSRWSTTAELVATGCWTSTQTWSAAVGVYRSGSHSFDIMSKAAGGGPFYTAYFWANLQLSYDTSCVVVNGLWYVCDWGNYGLWPRVYLSPGGRWTWSSSCNLNSGQDWGTCTAYIPSAGYSATWAG